MLEPFGHSLICTPTAFNEQTHKSGLVVPYQGQTCQLERAIVKKVGEVPGIEELDTVIYHKCETLTIGDDVVVPIAAIIAIDRADE